MKNATGKLFELRIEGLSTHFGKLIPGRTFVRADRPTEVWMKFDKNFAQPIDDSNMRVRISSALEVTECLLVPHFTGT